MVAENFWHINLFDNFSASVIIWKPLIKNWHFFEKKKVFSSVPWTSCDINCRNRDDPWNYFTKPVNFRFRRDKGVYVTLSRVKLQLLSTANYWLSIKGQTMVSFCLNGLDYKVMFVIRCDLIGIFFRVKMLVMSCYFF